MPEICNAMTVDVEDYFQVSALAPQIARSEWERMPCRVERNVERILELLAGAAARATFFTLGWIAERYPQLVRRIAAAGHEIASHGYEHRRASEQTQEEFRADIRRAKALLEHITGSEVKGYRAPSFSIGAATPWAFDCIAQAGYRYSSSVYPVRHDHYGAPDAPRFAYRPQAGVLEIPISTARLAGNNLPAGGGGYFRLFPYELFKHNLKTVRAQDRQPCMFYFHPWEIDDEQPRIEGTSFKTRVRHYLNLDRTFGRLELLLKDFRWSSVDQVFFAGPASRQ